jgi:hypothetical protein
MSKQLNSSNAELLARINGRHPLIAGYVEEVHRLYNKRATGQRKAMERQWLPRALDNGPGADILEELTHGRHMQQEQHSEEQQQLLAICSSDSRQVPQYSRGIAERVLAMWVQRRRGLALEDGMSESPLHQRDHSRRHAGVGYQQGALAI